MRLRILFLLVMVISFIAFPVLSEDKGLTVRIKNLDQNARVGKQWFVIIAINKYQNWNNLQNPVNDAEAFKEVLLRRYYIDEVVELYDNDASKENILKVFLDLQNKLKTHDSLLIFYSGHGHLDKLSKTGFWIPFDAGTDEFIQDNWIPNSQIRGIIRNMKSTHICLISDACFSGDILDVTKGKAPDINVEYFKNAYARVSRQVLTSGASETVPDRSEFAYQLIMTLEKSNSNYLDPLMIYNDIRIGVKDSTPLFGDLKYSGHQQGASFLLFLREEEVTEAGQEKEDISITITKSYGSIDIDVNTGGKLYIDGSFKADIPQASNVKLDNMAVGSHTLEMRYSGGQKEARRITVIKDKTINVVFMWKKRLDMVLVEAGSFSMGSTSGDSDEKPVHKVKISKDFYMSKYEVTFEQYDEFCNDTGRDKPGDSGWGRGNRPVININWYDAVEFCNWLSSKEGLTPCYSGSGENIKCNFTVDGYRLPTEAEWEYAARGGNKSRGYTYSGSNNAGDVGWYEYNSGNKTHIVGQKQANELGIYDMSGNVWEWCWDRYGSYSGSTQTDPSGPSTGSYHVLRGGSWFFNANYLRSAGRDSFHPGYRCDGFGFRPLRTVY